MKKSFIKLLYLAFSVILIFTSCNIANPKNENDFNIEQEEYLIKFIIIGPMLYEKYMFLLTPDDRLLAEYVDKNHKIHKFQAELNKPQLNLMKQYVDEVLTLKEDDITGYVNFSDFWECSISFDDVEAHFSYGASKNLSVNILLEQILGCCDSEKSLKTAKMLQDAPLTYRKMMAFYATIKEEE